MIIQRKILALFVKLQLLIYPIVLGDKSVMSLAVKFVLLYKEPSASPSLYKYMKNEMPNRKLQVYSKQFISYLVSQNC